MAEATNGPKFRQKILSADQYRTVLPSNARRYGLLYAGSLASAHEKAMSSLRNTFR